MADARGVTAVEFALVAAPFTMTLLGIIQTGYAFFLMAALDSAASASARAVTTGAISTAGLTATQFRDQVVCPKLPSTFVCANVFVTMSVVQEGQSPTGYYAYVNAAGTGLVQPPLDGTGKFCPGAGGQYVVLQVQYPTTYLTGLLASAAPTTFNGKPSYVLMASTTFRSEPYNGAVAYAGC
ncbi:TadE family protein [Methylobacterium nonmethylotrophicum]|uniref:TadE family protein n=1 Tax=Methylobacterium nonmethylotrophicum TaxID=1141884 RepID=UPI001436ADDE|nr:TadE family protein [Methylobacterium nonmethylotrophicum]